jgi:hypothetical protein
LVWLIRSLSLSLLFLPLSLSPSHPISINLYFTVKLIEKGGRERETGYSKIYSLKAI